MAMSRKKRPEPATKDDVALLRDDMTALGVGLAAVRGDMTALGGSLETVRGDVTALGGGLAAVRGDVTALRDDLTAVRDDLKRDIVRLAVEIDRRATKADVQDGFAVMNGKLDRMMTVLDRTAGELFDNRQSHTLFGAMIGDQRRILDAHDRRITGLESRFQP